MSIIYETSGRAREYFELAANLYSGCDHGCVYCYAADVTRKPRDEFARPQARLNVVTDIEKDAKRMNARGDDRHVLLSFISDPYQPLEKKLEVTRRVIMKLHEYGLNAAILTKGATLATRDFDILTRADAFGVTLTFLDDRRSRSWEPRADLPMKRIQALKEAHKRGIPTWVSLEPVIDPAESLALVEATAGYVDHYKVGPLNYKNKLPPQFHVNGVDWKNFGRNVSIILNDMDVSYYLKKDLARYMGQDEGIRKGDFTAWI